MPPQEALLGGQMAHTRYPAAQSGAGFERLERQTLRFTDTSLRAELLVGGALDRLAACCAPLCSIRAH